MRSGGKSLPASSESPRHCDVPDASTGPSAWAHGKVRQRTRPSKRPLPIHSTRCATYAIVVTVASPVTTRTRTPGQLGTGPSRRPGPTGRCRHRAHGTPAAHCRRRFAHRSGHSRSTAPAVPVLLTIVASQSPLEYPRRAAGLSRRPRPTGRCRHRAHGTSAADCRRRFAHRSGHSRSTAPAVLLTIVA